MLEVATLFLLMLSPVFVSPCEAWMSELILFCAAVWLVVCAVSERLRSFALAVWLASKSVFCRPRSVSCAFWF